MIPSHWPQFEVNFRHGSTTYAIVVENPQRRCKAIFSMTVDGVVWRPIRQQSSFRTTANLHTVHILMGEPAKDE